MPQSLQDELFELLRIPSVSTGGGDREALVAAAEWMVERVQRAGGTAGLEGAGGNPVAVGELSSGRSAAPTVLIYGHYDVQGVDPVDAWDSDPFEPVIRDGRIYARGASDDKGNFLPLLHVACELARAGELGVNVRVVVEGEEEAGGETVAKWFMEDERGADCAIVFDSDMVDARTPAITTSVRGIIAAEVKVRTAVRNLHSGMYGGSVLNAVHVLNRMLAGVLPGLDGRLRAELREGIADPSADETEGWAKLPPGEDVLAEGGGRPLDASSGPDYYLRNGADAAVDVNGIAGGDAVNARTIVPAEASARLSMRLAPGQSTRALKPVLERLLREGAPAGAEIEIDLAHSGDPALFDAASPALTLGARALGKAAGRSPAIVRSGGSIPILALFAERGIQTIVSGTALADDSIHAPNESFSVASLELGERAARALYEALADVPSGCQRSHSAPHHPLG